jgi:predicted chitinase
MGTENVKQIGGLFIVDPNPPGRDMIPPEDMFIYVKFSATPRSRFIDGGIENGVDGEVDFISTKIKYNTSGELDPKSQKTYSTTSWTNIGGLAPEESRGVLEGFGIKSIDIKYNASLVPVVDITFTDIRGAGLFDTIKDKKRLSPYSVFFKMPYPVFNLSVKGYFGQSIDYCLHMVNWSSNFDGSTGNFDISANFLGFQQAFLNDMNIGNIIGTVNTQRGFNNLERIFNEQDAKDNEGLLDEIGTTESTSATLEQIQKGSGVNTRKIDDFFTKIAKLQIDVEVLKSETDELDKLKQINTQLSQLKTIRTFIGAPIGKTNDIDGDGETTDEEIVAAKGKTVLGKFIKPTKTYLQLPNSNSQIHTSKINDDILQREDNYWSIRDYLLINSAQESAFQIYMETLHDLISNYVEYSEELGGSQVDSQNKDMISSFKLSNSKEDYWENFVVSLDDDTKVKPIKLPTVLRRMSSPGDPLNLQNTYTPNSDVNGSFKMKSFTAKTASNEFYPKGTSLSKNSNVIVVDFREQRERVQGVIEELKLIAKEVKDTVQKTLNDDMTKKFQEELGFRPTIDNCFRIIANNTQAMTATIWDITKESTMPGLKEDRSDALRPFKTDVPEDITDPIAWPSVYVENDSGALEEIYLGDSEHVSDTSSFPEVKFVEEVFTSLIAKTKSLEQTSKASVLKNGLDTDNWFPINPIDYKINPWITFSTRNDNGEMDSFIAENLFNRVAVLKNYSKWTPSTGRDIASFAALDGIAANKAFVTPDIRNIYYNKLKEIDADLDSILSTEFGKGLKLDAGDFVYTSQTPTTISGINIGGTNQTDVDYILFDTAGIVNNSRRMPSEITENTRFSAIKTKNPQSDGDFWNKDYRNSNVTTWLSYNVWDKEVSEKLKGKDNSIYKTFKIDSMSSIDLTGSTTPEGQFLNRTNFVSGNTCPYPQLLIQSDFYSAQSRLAKAILLLSTLPFKTFKEAVLSAAFPNGKYMDAKIINLPVYYVYFIGGLLWKSKEGGIDWEVTPSNDGCGYSDFSSPNSCYLTKVGYQALKSHTSDLPLEDELLNMPASTIDLFIKKFIDWADSAKFESFEQDMQVYRSSNSLSETQVSKASLDIKQRLSSPTIGTTNMIVLAPGIFDPVDGSMPENLKISRSDIKTYITNFLVTYSNIENGRKDTAQDNSESEISANATTNKIKLQIYNYFKNINDKWVSDIKQCFNVCGGSGGDKSLYDYFKFVDRGWNKIGDKATINLSSFLTLGSNLQTSVYFFMSKLLRDSNFLLQILPTFVDYKDAEEVSKMFKPVTTLQNNKSSGPMYCGIYIGAASTALDIKEESTYTFANDGFSLDNPTADISKEKKKGDNLLVAFRVAFGAENQTIFKNVSLNQQEHKETGEYFKALSELVDKRGGTQKVYQGTDLLKLFKTRSYTCKVDALGCMNIQPLMYFNLENVPFFNGAYLITSVNHNISPNHMTTSFTGVRQSKFISEPNEEILADLNLDLNETNEIPKIELVNKTSNNDIWKIGVLNPQEPFKFNERWKVKYFKQMGVDFNYVDGLEIESDVELQNSLNSVKDEMKSKGINTNSQVCMFVANVMAQSNYLIENKDTWASEQANNESDANIIKQVKFVDTIYKDNVRYYGDNSTIPADNPFKNILSDPANTPLGILGSTPTYTGTGADNAAWVSTSGARPEEESDKYSVIANALDSETISTSEFQKQLSGLTYYNIYPGDGWRFKPRGFLYVTGRREYFEYGDDYLKSPDKIVSSFLESFKAAIYVWKTKKPTNESTLKGPYKNSYDAAGGNGTDKDRNGTSSDFALTKDISCPKYSKSIGEAYNAFESVLLAFDLKDDNNP